MTSKFVPVAHYSTATEAEMHAEILRAAEIPVIIQGPQAGIFGGGFSGFSVQGVALLVPARQLAEARALIGEDDDHMGDEEEG